MGENMSSDSMEINSAAIIEMSDGNSLCTVCISYLTLGRYDDNKRDNLHVHFNGRKHKFRCKMFEKSLYTEDNDNDNSDDNNYGDDNIYGGYYDRFEKRISLKRASWDVICLYENGISCDLKRNFNLYCNFCDCNLPQLSKDKNSNIFNVNIHVTSKRHNYSILWNYGRCLTDKEKNGNQSLIFLEHNVEPFVEIPQPYTSIIAAVHLDDKCLIVEEIFRNLQDRIINSICYDINVSKFRCNFCDCVIGVSNKTIKIINNLICHIEGRKHLSSFKNFSNESSFKHISLDEIEDANLMNILKMTKNKIINKNEIYICRNSKENIMCKICNCVLPDVGKGGYLLAIKNFEIHFLGKRHSRLVRQNLKQEIDKIVKKDSTKCDKLISKLFNELPSSLSKNNANYFMISKTFNLVCKICSCIIYRKVEFSGPNQQVTASLKIHIESSKHMKNDVLKEGLRNYEDISDKLKLKKSPSVKSECKFSSSRDSSQTVIKLDSCGQLVCSLCHKVIILKNCKLELAVMSHLKGKIHKCRNASQSNKLTENILSDIINSLPKDYQINKKYLSFIFKFGIVNCNICNYMFTVNNNYKLRNNLMLHIKSTKHRNMLSKMTTDNENDDSASGVDDMTNVREVINDYYSLALKNPKSELHHVYETDFLKNNDFTLLLDIDDADFLECVFQNYIPKYLISNKKCVSLKSKSNAIYCHACCCTIATLLKKSDSVLCLLNHLTEDFHTKKVKIFERREFFLSVQQRTFSEKNLKSIFKNHLPSKWLTLQNHIQIISNTLYCVSCKRNLLSTNNSNQTIVRELKLHFNRVHVLPSENSDNEVNSEKIINSEFIIKNVPSNVGEVKYVSELFINYIQANLHSNKKYIMCNKKLKRLSCCLCNYNFIWLSKSPETNATNLIFHLKGISHQVNLKKYEQQVTENIVKTQNTSTTAITNPCSAKNVSRKPLSNEKNMNPSANSLTSTKDDNSVLTSSKSTKDSSVSTEIETDVYEMLDNVFKNLSVKLQFNRQFITIKSNNINCNICGCQLTKSNIPEAMARLLTEHINGGAHQKNISSRTAITDPCSAKNVSSKPLSNEKNMNPSANSPTSTKDDNSVLTSSKSTKDSSVSSNYSHNSEIEFDVNEILDNVFKSLSVKLQFNRQFITIKSNNINCNICRCQLSKPNIPEAMARFLTEHINGVVHQNNLKLECKIGNASNNNNCTSTSEGSKKYETILDQVFKECIHNDFQLNKQFLALKSQEIECVLCDVFLPLPKNYSVYSLSNIVMIHIQGGLHTSNLKQNVNTDISFKKGLDDISSNNSVIQDDESYLEKMFSKYIPHDIYCIKPSIHLESGKIICNICNNTFSVSNSPQDTANALISHMKQCKLKSIMETNKAKVKNVIEYPTDLVEESSCAYDHDSSSFETFLNDVFETFIPQDLKFNRQFLIVKLDKVTCAICNCALLKSNTFLSTASSIILDHIKGSSHVTALEKKHVDNGKSYENYSKSDKQKKHTDKQKMFSDKQKKHTYKHSEKVLDEVFAKFIPHEIKFNRQYISIQHNKLECNVCNCTLMTSADSPLVTSNVLLDHIKGPNHEDYVKNKNINDDMLSTDKSSIKDDQNSYEKFLDDVFEMCIPQDFKFNRQFLIVEPDKLTCNVCNCALLKVDGIFSAASTVLDHLKLSSHIIALKK